MFVVARIEVVFVMRAPSDIRVVIEEREDALLSGWALRARDARRVVAEAESDMRSAYQRDRDRIIHSKAYRRMKHKSQVLLAPAGDHYTTRLTHVMEVAQVGRTIARGLNLNEDMVEAAALGHDVGHTPFGHVGEAALARLLPSGFHHSRHSVRILERLERGGRGLNLTRDVVEAVRLHSKPPGEFMSMASVVGMSLEAQIVRLSDAIAYLMHDIRDALRTGWLAWSDFPSDVMDFVGVRHSERLDRVLHDVVVSSWDCTSRVDGASEPWIRMSDEMTRAITELREFMFARFYHVASGKRGAQRAQALVELILEYLWSNPARLSEEALVGADGDERQAAVDYLCGMTDQFAMRFGEEIAPGSSEGIAFE